MELGQGLLRKEYAMITGGFYYGGSRAAQHNDVRIPFEELIDKIRPSQVIELGTCDGGLTILLRDIMDKFVPKSELLTIDCNECKIRDPRITYRVMGFWDGNEMCQEIVDFVQRPGLTLVLVDGGDKPREFQKLAPHIKPNDVIMAHDYALDKDYFELYINGVIWNWHEIQESDIAEVSKSCSLVPLMAEEFQRVVWVCKQRVV